MFGKKTTEKHLIDDSGVYKDTSHVKVTAFVVLCRLITLVLIFLGPAALIVGNM